jgi:hypothetical protein
MILIRGTLCGGSNACRSVRVRRLLGGTDSNVKRIRYADGKQVSNHSALPTHLVFISIGILTWRRRDGKLDSVFARSCELSAGLEVIWCGAMMLQTCIEGKVPFAILRTEYSELAGVNFHWIALISVGGCLLPVLLSVHAPPSSVFFFL